MLCRAAGVPLLPQENAGGGALGSMLAVNLGLKVLEMSSCRLGPAACLLIADGLRVRGAPAESAPACCRAVALALDRAGAGAVARADAGRT